MVSGIYSILNNVNGKQYIGQTYEVQQRKIQHFSDLRCGRHHNVHLQRSFNKYGEDVFSFKVLEYCEKSKLNDLEKFYIEKFKTNNPQLGYNETLGGDNPPVFFGENNNRYRQDVWVCEEDICNCYLNNHSIEEITKKFNGSSILIRSILRNNNIPTRNHSDANKRLDVWEHENAICNYYSKDKWSIMKISKKFNTSPTVIRNILISNNISIRNFSESKKRWDVWEKEDLICSEYKQGDSLKQLSEEYACCIPTIKKILKKNNIPIINNSERMNEKYISSFDSWMKEDIMNICECYLNDNMSLTQISEKFNVSRDIIHKILVKNNIPIRNSKYIQKANGVAHVYKKKYNGKYRWKYVYDENGKKKEITSVNPQKLKRKVLDKGFDWIILNERNAKKNNLL